MEQRLDGKGYDFGRTARFTLIGFAYVAPMLHVWFGALTRFLPAANLATALKRTAIDQSLFAPTFITLLFGLLLTLDGKPEHWAAKMKEDFVPTMKTNWMVWAPAQLINFRYIPPAYQVCFLLF